MVPEVEETPLASGLDSLPGIGARRAEALTQAWGVRTVGELLRILPARYEEAAQQVELAAVAAAEVPEGERVRVAATVAGSSVWRRGRRSLLTVRLQDGEAKVAALYFNQPYLKNSFPAGRELLLEGRVRYARTPQLLSPRIVTADAEGLAPRPEYPDAAGVPAAALRKAMVAAVEYLPGLEDPIPEPIRALAAVPRLADALAVLHAPPDAAALEHARRRLAWGEVLRVEHRRLRARPDSETATPVPPAAWERIRARIPFTLTDEQEAAVQTLRADLERAQPMRRLLHGEVGSGKTAVAFAAMLAVAAAGGQATLLAPTEILARQHIRTFRSWLQGARLKLVGLFGDDSAQQRRENLAALRSGHASLAIGTHALFSEAVEFSDLALVVFDEQHRFGVKQKAALVAKGAHPHVLTMTATPIPRTLAWSRYGALDPIVLRTRAGAQSVLRTTVHSEQDWLTLAEELTPQLRGGDRAFVVAPRIDGEGGLLRWRELLLDGPWRGLRSAMAHGRMPGGEAEAAVARLRIGTAQVLFGTTMVEVGLDVPDVPHMMVMGAERLGLASLHQLRGRLARGVGARPGHCRMLAAPDAVERLRILERCENGFQVAEEDLRLRGPGALIGTRQHGRSGFRVFDPVQDADLVGHLPKEEVRNWLRNLD